MNEGFTSRFQLVAAQVTEGESQSHAAGHIFCRQPPRNPFHISGKPSCQSPESGHRSTAKEIA